MKITATFIDEISHDIPHQNWGAKEWEQDFEYMKKMGIDTVVLIRAGYRKFLSYPSAFLIEHHACFTPSQDLVKLFFVSVLSNEYLWNSTKHYVCQNLIGKSLLY